MTVKQRNYGLDILRVLCMNMIIILHVAQLGGGTSTHTFSLKWHISWFWFVISNCAVDVFALLSGYVGYGKKHSLKQIVYWCFVAVFYSVTITLILHIFTDLNISKKQILKSFIPFIYQYNWYFNAYFVIYFFMPALDKAVEFLSARELKRLLISMFFIFSLLPTFFQKDLYHTGNGFTPLWLALLYIVGASLRKLHETPDITPPLKKSI